MPMQKTEAEHQQERQGTTDHRGAGGHRAFTDGQEGDQHDGGRGGGGASETTDLLDAAERLAARVDPAHRTHTDMQHGGRTTEYHRVDSLIDGQALFVPRPTGDRESADPGERVGDEKDGGTTTVRPDSAGGRG
ncbi:hypothetical protein AB0875_01125 [Micromonospora gifhornensis]|uniref:hypothetical protein n=1 Tax=Micromonospora gifhornensis TaxID=84594 RepID=UPI003452474A